MTSVSGPATPTSSKMLAASVNNTKNHKEKSELDSGLVSCDTNGSGVNILSEIKQEEPLDIDDTTPADNAERMPIISLTPTSKLLATPNPTDPKRKFVCPYDNCGKSYGKSSHLRSHLTWHTGIKPFVCQEPNCGKGFTRSDELNRHVRTHTGEKPFECMQCTKKFSRSDHLTKHLATHVKHQKTPIRNSIYANSTNDTTPSKKLLPDAAKFGGHAMTVAPTPSKNPKMDNIQTVSAKQLFNINLQAMERYEDEKINSNTHGPIKIKLERPENSSEYQIVPTSISKNASLVDENNSELIVGDDEIMPEANAPPTLSLGISIKNEPEDSETERPFRCEHCFKAFHSENDLNLHRHVHSEDQSLQPDTILPLQTNGSNHASLHKSQADSSTSQSYFDPERPFRCTECPRAFRRQDDLHRHIRTHTGEKPFACNECDRRFVRSDHLKKHLQTHIRLR